MRRLFNDLREVVARRRSVNDVVAQASGARIDPTVHVRSPERLILGAGCFIDAGVVIHCGGMDWSPGDGGIRVGARSYVGPNCVLFGAAGIDIGEAVLISPGVVITSHQHSFAESRVDIREQPLRFARVVIEHDVWIGANATVLPGVTLGSGSVVGAGAVVTRDVPARTVVLGVPARVARVR